jgi:sialate O-acetylesterase
MKLFSRLAVFSLATAGLAHADVKLPAIISDHMVLQREMADPIWGWADPGETVTVKIAQQSKTATPGADGRWQVKLDPLQPGTALTLTVAGKNTITVKDVTVGEVWLGSGQSNMGMQVQAAQNFEEERAAATLPEIRVFTEVSAASDTPQTIGKGVWVICSPETVGRFSATLYFFGRELHKVIGGNLGLINSSVGGTPIESWIDASKQREVKDLKGFFADLDKANSAFNVDAAKAKYEKDLAAWKEVAAKAKAEGQKPPLPPRDPIALRARKGNVGGLFNGKIAPLIPYAIRGAIWYQGEANGTPAKASYYQYQLPLLVTDWRARWGEGDFPFAWAQLPNIGEAGRDWPTVREGMLKTLRLKNTGMGVNIDIGEEKNVHPKNKQEVGRRLALWALGTVYGKKVPATSGPLPTTHEVRGKEMVLSFSHTDGGLLAKGGELRGFEIAGDDGKYVKATAKIEGNKVIVSSPAVPKPSDARYSWANWPDGNLYNGAGLPASPFRTDCGCD